MRNPFRKAVTTPLSEAERALKSWGKKYEKQPDGSLVVPGDLNISGKGLAKLPNLSSVSVSGGFYCNHNQLTSLEGAPHTVGGNFWCYDNRLTSLEHAPHTVGGGFSCSANLLTSLEHVPRSIGGDFCCSYNQITSLEHAPKTVGGYFSCPNNQLASLEHAPRAVGGNFFCNHNQLTSLEHAPQEFTKLMSDFGEFSSWQEVPQTLRLSPETKALQQEATVQAATVLSNPLRIGGTLRFKTRAPT